MQGKQNEARQLLWPERGHKSRSIAAGPAAQSLLGGARAQPSKYAVKKTGKPGVLHLVLEPGAAEGHGVIGGRSSSSTVALIWGSGLRHACA